MRPPHPRRRRLRTAFLVLAIVLAGMTVAAPAALAAPPGPLLSVSDADTVEGNVGSVDLVFTVRLSNPTGRIVTVDYSAGGAKVGDATGDGLIRNDDAAPPPPPATFALSVARSGAGAGTVISSPAGVSCGSDCSEAYPDGTVVSLTATPEAGSTFAGWSGACSGTGACSVTMSAARAVTAMFEPAAAGTFTLTVVGSRTPTTIAVVFSEPDGIGCGTEPGQDRCAADFPAGATVTLYAVAAQGTFSGWGFDCAGTPPDVPCTLQMSSDHTVAVTFT